MFDRSKVKAGDKVLLRDGSKIVVDDRGGKQPLMILTSYLTIWDEQGRWAVDTYPNCPFDIIAVIPQGAKS